MIRILPIILLVASGANLHGQIRLDGATLVNKSDPIYPALEEYRSKLYRGSEYIVPEFLTDWIDVRSPAAARLFPTLRFAAICWNEDHHPKSKEKPAGLALGLSITVVVDTSSNKIKTLLSHWGNYDQFGELLAEHKVLVQNAADAKLVWDAFCETHYLHWQSQPAVKQSDTVWHLGDETRSRFHYYYKVLLDELQRVKSARLCADEIEKH